MVREGLKEITLGKDGDNKWNIYRKHIHPAIQNKAKSNP
jgi:hypothetical protein